MNIKNNKKGVALFIAVIAVSALMIIAAAISDIAFKEQTISYSGRDSKVAFYAADSGMECALFYDLKGGNDGLFVFATSSGGVRTPTLSGCTMGASGNPIPITPRTQSISDAATTTFYFNVDSAPADSAKACVVVEVSKTLKPGGSISTKIESRGYNNYCTGHAYPDEYARNLERSFRVNY